MTDYSVLIKDVFQANELDNLLNSLVTEKLNILIDRMTSVNENMNLTAIKSSRFYPILAAIHTA